MTGPARPVDIDLVVECGDSAWTSTAGEPGSDLVWGGCSPRGKRESAAFIPVHRELIESPAQHVVGSEVELHTERRVFPLEVGEVSGFVRHER